MASPCFAAICTSLQLARHHFGASHPAGNQGVLHFPTHGSWPRGNPREITKGFAKKHDPMAVMFRYAAAQRLPQEGPTDTGARTSLVGIFSQGDKKDRARTGKSGSTNERAKARRTSLATDRSPKWFSSMTNRRPAVVPQPATACRRIAGTPGRLFQTP